MPKAAILDANVLYSAPLRDLLLQLAFVGLYQARWSAEIDDEWNATLSLHDLSWPTVLSVLERQCIAPYLMLM